MLGVEALQAGEFELAKRVKIILKRKKKKCFMRNKDLSMIELTSKWEKERKLDESA